MSAEFVPLPESADSGSFSSPARKDDSGGRRKAAKAPDAPKPAETPDSSERPELSGKDAAKSEPKPAPAPAPMPPAISDSSNLRQVETRD